MARVHLGLGANLGDRLATLRAALASLEQLGRVVARSSVWETEAIGPPPDYLNAVVELETALEPAPLLEALLGIEEQNGRVRTGKDAPRTLDLDVLLWGDRIVEHEQLRVPHPRLAERSFVLEPLAEVAPEAIHPTLHRTVEELRARLSPSKRARRLAEPL